MADHRVGEQDFSLLLQSEKSSKDLSLLQDIGLNHKQRKTIIIVCVHFPTNVYLHMHGLLVSPISIHITCQSGLNPDWPCNVCRAEIVSV